jgi:hypothetical protein
VLKMMPSYLLWCLWRKMNDRSFEDREKTLEEHKSFFFNILYFWAAAFVSLLAYDYHDFLFFFLLLARCFLFYTFMCFSLLIIFRLLMYIYIDVVVMFLP